jgi:hypothetical protein
VFPNRDGRIDLILCVLAAKPEPVNPDPKWRPSILSQFVYRPQDQQHERWHLRVRGSLRHIGNVDLGLTAEQVQREKIAACFALAASGTLEADFPKLGHVALTRPYLGLTQNDAMSAPGAKERRWGYANSFPDVVCLAVIVETGVIALGSLLGAKPKADSTPEAPKG